MQKLKFNSSMFIDNVLGICPECKEEAFLVAIVQDYYRCTNCGGQWISIAWHVNSVTASIKRQSAVSNIKHTTI